MKLFVSFLWFVLVFNASLLAQSPARSIPIFQFFRLDKSSFTNKDLTKGKPHFFIFFDATCDHCQRAVAYINQHQNDFKKASMYFITLDNRKVLDGFMNTYGPNLKGKTNIVILQDLKNEFIKKFGPKKYPGLFLYSTQNDLIMYADEDQYIANFAAIIKK